MPLSLFILVAKLNTMKAIRDRVFLALEKETEDTVTLGNGLELFIDTAFDRARHARQYGYVVSVSDTVHLYKEYDDGVDLKVGDKVWFHHFAIEKNNVFKIGEKTYYTLPYAMLFLLERGDEYIPLNEFVFVRPCEAVKEVNGLVNPLVGDLSKRRAEVVYINDKSKAELGIDVGSIVDLTGRGNYDMKIGGEVLYRLRHRQLIAERL